MSSEFGENFPYFCDFARTFVILPVFLLFSHGQSVSEQLQLFIYAFLSSKCRCIYAFFLNKNFAFGRGTLAPLC